MSTTQEITRNLGGNRLGSGNKNNISMHAYNRSTHDLSRVWKSSMNVGTLVPFLKVFGLDGDTFSIDMDSIVRTLPSKAPLYGSYKMQLDVFECPVRLYNGLLHNNMVNIGLNMKDVILPKIELSTKILNRYNYNVDLNNAQIASDALLNYLGIKGIGDFDFTGMIAKDDTVTRKFNAVPIMAYYDIYKCYYSNKQEEKGVMIVPDLYTSSAQAKKAVGMPDDLWQNDPTTRILSDIVTAIPGVTLTTGEVAQLFNMPTINCAQSLSLSDWSAPIEYTTIYFVVKDTITNVSTRVLGTTLFASSQVSSTGILFKNLDPAYILPTKVITGVIFMGQRYIANAGLKLQTFDLSEIDDMRIEVLQSTGLANEFLINASSATPLQNLCSNDTDGYSYNKYHQNGLCIKTYQSDLFNNWLKTEWLDGVNGINKITRVDTSSGSFEIDALNLANKIYNMLNRVAVSGGTYEDWREAVFSVRVTRRAETPVYKGGMSAEIIFSEVVSNAATEDDPLGTLAGKGGEHAKQGGKLEIRCGEPSYIIGIVSLTPRIDYSQGNDWDMTELDSMDDVHKPALDGIGFEDLLQERMAWWGTYWDPNTKEWIKLAAGKVPAWSNYMTAVNETHGTFAEPNNTMFMTLNRQYQYSESGKAGITDLTTYIDPARYNYIFAEETLEAQNFWVQIGMKITARRVMSAKIIPYL